MCRPTWGEKADGGEHSLHPLNPLTAEWFDTLDGFHFRPIHAVPATLPALPPFVAQLRYRSPLRGRLPAAAYALRPPEVVRRRGVVTAAEQRERFGLSPRQVLIVLPFGNDAHLERMWDAAALDELAGAGYDAVVAPSYSLWAPRPRPEFLIAAKRSPRFFAEMQEREVPAIPRVGWVFDFDVRRFAGWVRANPAVEWVAIDWQTYRGERAFREQLTGLARFDELTGRRVRYLINGSSTMQRHVEIYRTVAPERVTLTNARAPSARPRPDVNGQSWAERHVNTYLGRCAEDEQLVVDARAVLKTESGVSATPSSARAGHTGAAA